jgi:hypothetical protein
MTATAVPDVADKNVAAQDQPGEKTKAAPNRIKLTRAELNELLKSGARRQEIIWDTEEKGLCVLRSRGPKGKHQSTLTFRVAYYLPSNPGVPRYKAIGRYPLKYPASDQGPGLDCSNLKAVRDRARQIRMDAKSGIDPKRPRLSGNFKAVVARFIDEHAKRNNQTWKETQRIFDRYVVPEWQDRNVEEIKKDDVSQLLNRIGNGKIKYDGQWIGTQFVARATRVQLGVFFNWYVEHYSSNEFRSPIVKSKQWKGPAPRPRDLDHDEIRALWQAATPLGVYGAVVKAALLTAQRFRKVATMRRSDLKEVRDRSREIRIDHAWDPTRDADPKNKQVSVVPLSALAREVINSVPVIDSDRPQDCVFTFDGRQPIQGLSKLKRRLDQAMLAALRQQAADRGDDPDQVELKPWQHRDLRRTAKTLMLRAGVSRDISERCLAHVIRGVEGTYDRYDYLREKQEAFDQLAAKVGTIVSPPPENVVPIRSGGRGRRAANPRSVNGGDRSVLH